MCEEDSSGSKFRVCGDSTMVALMLSHGLQSRNLRRMEIATKILEDKSILFIMQKHDHNKIDTPWAPLAELVSIFALQPRKDSVKQMVRRKYSFDLEIFESGCQYHEVGSKYRYPEDKAKICSWLLDSANIMIGVLEYDGKLPWTYPNTPYTKVINSKGKTTEFVRCPDPTSAGVVLKITRKKLSPKEVKTTDP